MAKKKAVPKTKKKAAHKGKKKAAAPRKAPRKKPTPKRGSSRGKTPGTGVLLEVTEVEVIGEPEDVANDEVFPPDYGGSE